MWKGFIDLIPIGGHIFPISNAGLMEKWKNVQKKDKKNITSDKINKSIPIFNKFFTFKVWKPEIVDSRMISLTQTKKIKFNIVNEKVIWKILKLNLLLVIIKIERIKFIKTILIHNGQGEGKTKKKSFL